MRTPRRHFLQKVASAAALAGFSPSAWALDYPTRPIHWVIGFPPGGGADIVARIMGAWLSERLGQQTIIENKLINSPPDGYTLPWAGISNVINASIYGTLSFDFLRDIAPVAGMVVYPLVFEVHPSVPAKNLPELIAYAKANPGKITLASYGTGTISQVAGELFKTRAGINMVHVPIAVEHLWSLTLLVVKFRSHSTLWQARFPIFDPAQSARWQ